MAGVKIVDLPALGRDLISTDLLEVSLNGSGSRKITGQEIMNASKLAIGSTPIVSGTVGRLLFQGTGDVLQQSGNLFWDNPNLRLGIGISTPLYTLDVAGNIHGNSIFAEYNIVSSAGNVWLGNGYAIGDWGTGNNRIEFYSNRLSFFGNGNEALRIVGSTGNLLVNTVTDAGFKLDVNGTARVQGQLTLSNSTFPQLNISGTANNAGIFLNRASTSFASQIRFQTAGSDIWTWQLQGNSTNNLSAVRFNGSWLESMTLFYSTGNVGINTTTDDGFKLDVNGTARVQGLTTIRTTGSSYNSPLFVENTGSAAVDNINVATFQGNRGNASTITDNTNVSIWQKNNTVNNYALLSFLNSAGNSAAYIGTQFLNHGSGQNGNLFFGTASSGGISPKMTLFSTGNVGINTTTDAGFKLDVNGNARVRTTDTSTPLNIAHSGSVGIQIEANANGYRMRLASTTTFSDISTPDSYLTLNQSGQRVVIGSSTIYNSAQLAVDSTTRGFLTPRMTNAQRAAIASPAVGLIVYCTDATEGLYVYKSTGWTFMV